MPKARESKHTRSRHTRQTGSSTASQKQHHITAVRTIAGYPGKHGKSALRYPGTTSNNGTRSRSHQKPREYSSRNIPIVSIPPLPQILSPRARRVPMFPQEGRGTILLPGVSTRFFRCRARAMSFCEFFPFSDLFCSLFLTCLTFSCTNPAAYFLKSPD